MHHATLHIPTTIPPWCTWEQAWPILKAEHPTICDDIHEIEAHNGRMIAIATVNADTITDDHPDYLAHIIEVCDEHGNPIDYFIKEVAA